jgi:hypothetical protein
VQAALGMGNKFHKSAALALEKRYGAAEAVGILEQYRKEVAAHGRERGVQTSRIGQWFSGQLKSVDAQLKEGAFAHALRALGRRCRVPGHSIPPRTSAHARTCPSPAYPRPPRAHTPTHPKSIPTALVVSPLLELPVTGQHRATDVDSSGKGIECS